MRRMCKTLQVHFSGYYAWSKHPESKRDLENKTILQQIKEAYEHSGRIYGYRTVTKDLMASGIVINKKRVARLMGESLGSVGFSLWLDGVKVFELAAGAVPETAFRLPPLRGRRWQVEVT